MGNKGKPSGPQQPERKGGGGTRDGGKQNKCGECGEVNGRHAVGCSRR
jgi:hypothetical protein